jgi:hypothetical protein
MKARLTTQDRKRLDQEGIRKEKTGKKFKKDIRKRRKGNGRNQHAIQIAPLFRVKVLDIPAFIFLMGQEIGFPYFVERRVGAGKYEKESHQEDKENSGPFFHSLCDLFWKDLAQILITPKGLVKRKKWEKKCEKWL